MNAISGTSGSGRERMLTALPWLWLGLAALWAVVIFTTDQAGGPLAIWIAMTLGPIAVLQRRLNTKTDKQPKREVGSN